MATTPYYSPKLTHQGDTWITQNYSYWSDEYSASCLCAGIIDRLYSIDHKKACWIVALDKPPRHNHWFKVSKQSINNNAHHYTQLRLTSAKGMVLAELIHSAFSDFLMKGLTHFDNPNYIYIWLEQYK